MAWRLPDTFDADRAAGRAKNGVPGTDRSSHCPRQTSCRAPTARPGAMAWWPDLPAGTGLRDGRGVMHVAAPGAVVLAPQSGEPGMGGEVFTVGESAADGVVADGSDEGAEGAGLHRA